MFGSRPEKNDPEIDKLNFWFILIGPIMNLSSHDTLLLSIAFWKPKDFTDFPNSSTLTFIN